MLGVMARAYKILKGLLCILSASASFMHELEANFMCLGLCLRKSTESLF